MSLPNIQPTLVEDMIQSCCWIIPWSARVVDPTGSGEMQRWSDSISIHVLRHALGQFS